MTRLHIPINFGSKFDIPIVLKDGKNRPHYYHKENDTYWVIIDALHQFTIENNIFYELNYNYDCLWYIIFKNTTDAIIFKLTWGGIYV